MGPDRCHPVKARAVRAPINPSVSKGSTEVEPSCSASALSNRPVRRRNGAARLLQRLRLQPHRSLPGLEPVDHAAARQRMGRIWSACAHTRPGRSFRIHSENTRCATGVRRRGLSRFTFSKISRHSNGEATCAIRCTGRTPVRDRATRRIAHCRSPSRVPRAVRLLRRSPGSESGSMPGMAARSGRLRSLTRGAAGPRLACSRRHHETARIGQHFRTPLRSRDERPEHPNRSYRSAHPSIPIPRRLHGELLHPNLRLSAPMLP